jgi:hypothetical protein
VRKDFLLMVVLSVLLCACSKKGQPSEQTQTEVSVDHIVHLTSGESKEVVHGVFPVNKYVQFSFVVPPSEAYSKLHGDFRSFTKRREPDATSDKAADVGLMLLNDQEFADFQQGRPGSTTYEVKPAHDQVVDWQVPNTYDQPQQYHLVFSNPDGGPKTKFVKADFSISFK